MTYLDVRGKIQSGDVIGIRGNSLLDKIIRGAQRIAGLKDYKTTHCGIAWWVKGRLYSVEMDGKHNVLRPVSQYVIDGCGIDVYRLPENVLNFVRMNFDRATFTPIEYGFFDLIKIGARLLLGADTGYDSQDSDLVCSTFVARWLHWSLWESPRSFPKMPSPAELVWALGDPVYSIC